jgi:hypothetical protein
VDVNTHRRECCEEVYGPVMDKGEWRIRYNFELYRFMGGKDTVRFIKGQIIQWLVM